ncbi:hypothetical protein BDR05DRAFT_991117 [Suillus weaverae]|nr:hypothetical protein BDR05DRAFT_991117 [Suillus weaverae]
MNHGPSVCTGTDTVDVRWYPNYDLRIIHCFKRLGLRADPHQNGLTGSGPPRRFPPPPELLKFEPKTCISTTSNFNGQFDRDFEQRRQILLLGISIARMTFNLNVASVRLVLQEGDSTWNRDWPGCGRAPLRIVIKGSNSAAKSYIIAGTNSQSTPSTSSLVLEQAEAATVNRAKATDKSKT